MTEDGLYDGKARVGGGGQNQGESDCHNKSFAGLDLGVLYSLADCYP